MDKVFNFNDSDDMGLYIDNALIKSLAEYYSKVSNEENMERLLFQLVIRIAFGGRAPTPMVDTGVIMLISSVVEDKGKQWLPLYTDMDEVLICAAPEYTVELPIRDLVEEAFQNNLYEGLVINPNSARVFLNKDELDFVLDKMMRIDAVMKEVRDGDDDE